MVELNARTGSSLARLGRDAEAHVRLGRAVEGFEERLRMGADDPFTRYYAAIALELRGRRDRAMESLEAAARLRPAFTVRRAEREPDFTALRRDPRFSQIASGGDPA